MTTAVVSEASSSFSVFPLNNFCYILLKNTFSCSYPTKQEIKSPRYNGTFIILTERKFSISIKLAQQNIVYGYFFLKYYFYRKLCRIFNVEFFRLLSFIIQAQFVTICQTLFIFFSPTIELQNTFIVNNIFAINYLTRNRIIFNIFFIGFSTTRNCQ